VRFTDKVSMSRSLPRGTIVGPLLLMCLSVFSFFVTGRFEKIFNEFEVTLPLVTKIMFNPALPIATSCLAVVLLLLTFTPRGKSIGYLSVTLALAYFILLINALFIPALSMIKSFENSR